MRSPARALLDAHCRPGILLRRPYPPSALPDVRSRLGGLPSLPAAVDWPRAATSGTPLHFLAQIDCAELPPSDLLPEVGLLLFFAKVDDQMLWDESVPAESCRVVYDPSPQRPTGVRAAPPDLPPREGGWSFEQQTFGLEGEAGPSSYPPWPLIAAEMDTWPDYFALPDAERDAVDFSTYRRAHCAAQVGAILAASGLPPVAYCRPSWGDHSRVEDGYRVRQLLMPAKTDLPFPQTRIMIDRIARAIALACRREAGSQSDSPENAQILAIERVARDFVVEAGVFGPEGAPRPDQTRDFAVWLASLLEDKGILCDDAVLALEAGMRAAVTFAAGSPETARLIPAEYYCELEWEHAPSRVHSQRKLEGFHHEFTTFYHQMLGHAPRPIGSSKLVLLNLVSDDAVGFRFCDMGEVAFWIEPDDLAARRFENVFATTCGG